jgi:hypothetical protein
VCFGWLLELFRDGLERLRGRLSQIDRDPQRDLLVAQWKKRREVHWPEHRIKAVLQDVLHVLNRQDNINGLFNRLKDDMRKELARHLGTPEGRERAIRAWLEEQLLYTYPPSFPLIRRDLIDRGVRRATVHECLKYLEDEYRKAPELTAERLLNLTVERYGGPGR